MGGRVGDDQLVPDGRIERGPQSGPDTVQGRGAGDLLTPQGQRRRLVAGVADGLHVVGAFDDRLDHRRDVTPPQPVEPQMPQMRDKMPADVFGVFGAGRVGQVTFAGQPLLEPLGHRGLPDQPGTGLQSTTHGVDVGQPAIGGDGVLDQITQPDLTGGVATVRDRQQRVEVQQVAGGVTLTQIARMAQGASGAVGAARQIALDVPGTVSWVPRPVRPFQLRAAPAEQTTRPRITAVAAFVDRTLHQPGPLPDRHTEPPPPAEQVTARPAARRSQP